MRDLVVKYLDFLRYEQLGSENTGIIRKSGLYKLVDYLETREGIYHIEEIKLHHLRAYISYLRTEEGCEPSSVCTAISTLRSFFHFAEKKGYVSKNLALKLKKPQVQQKEVEYFTWEEIEKLFLSVPRGRNFLRDTCILLMFYYCGLRRSELKHVKIADLSSDLSELYVEKAKGEKSRLLPVHPFLKKTLKLYLEDCCYPDQVYLFPNKSGHPIADVTIHKIVKKCGEKAGINDKRVSPHVFRHSFATHLHQKGVDIHRLSQLLGHVNIEKTAIYTHTEDEELVEAVSNLV